jgi:Na+/H+-dicarboxylate symporter
VDIISSLLNLVGMPLLIVATVYGLRHLLLLPHPAKRVAMIVGISISALWVCAQTGVVVAHLSGMGSQLDASSQRFMGELVLGAGELKDSVALNNSEPDTPQTKKGWSFPDNVFLALATGQLPSVMLCIVLFGIAFTVQPSSLSDTTMGMFEAVYRSLEKIIELVNLAAPLIVMSYAVQLAANWNTELLHSMSGFLVGILGTFAALCMVLVFIIYKLGKSSAVEVLSALKLPMLLAMVSPSSIAAVPTTVDALSNRLGFSRGIVEMLVPTSAVFLRCGAALQYAMLAVFIAHLYQRPLSIQELMTISVLATGAALASSGSYGLTSLGYASIVVDYLNLPYEAALPLFLAVELFCEGPSRLLSLLSGCAMTAMVCGGLPLEKRKEPNKAPGVPSGPLRIVMTRGAVGLVAACILVAGALSVALGIAFGIRQPFEKMTPNLKMPTSQAPNT